MRVFGLIMAFVTTTTLLNPRSGPLHFLLWLPKLLASALSPLVVAASWLPILVGRRRHDPLLVGLGITVMCPSTASSSKCHTGTGSGPGSGR